MAIYKERKNIKPQSHPTLKDFLSARILKAAASAGFHAEEIPFSLEPPANLQYGEYATNIALLLSSRIKKSPHAIAQAIVTALDADTKLHSLIKKQTVAGPGFINFYLTSSYGAQEIRRILQKGDEYGRSNVGKNKKVQVEFISANPTGPLTLGNGRGGFLGDALSNVLAYEGYDVLREYYVNDTGEQIKKLGWSVIAAGRISGTDTLAMPYTSEELYLGGYIQELAYKLEIPNSTIEEIDVEAISRTASQLLLSDIKRVVKKAKISFDTWFSEKSLHRQGLVKEVLGVMQRKGIVEKKDDALWLTLRDDPTIQGRVLMKSSGEATYLLSDITYHYDKFKRRRFKKVIDIFGADHHATARALRAALKALQLPQPDIILVQLVRLIENGQEVRMSKRTGTFVTLEELIDTVGLDAARFFFLMREPNSHMDFDLSLAKEKSEKNPVYYVQYAHARCESILEKAHQAGVAMPTLNKEFPVRFSEIVQHPSELALIKKLLRLPEVLEAIAEDYEVSRLPYYATEVATAFSAFYRDCHVLGDDKTLSQMRLALVQATKIVLANTLCVMGIHAPEKM